MRSLLIALHIICAIGFSAVLFRQLSIRAHEVSEIRAQWIVDHAETERMQREMELQKVLLGGLRTKDPYVVELMARERHDYSRQGEYAMPPAPTIDKAATPR